MDQHECRPPHPGSRARRPAGEALAIAVDADGRVLVTGASRASSASRFADYATVPTPGPALDCGRIAITLYRRAGFTHMMHRGEPHRFEESFASHDVFCHIRTMGVIIEHAEPRPLSAEDLFQFWSRHSDEFMDWQRKNFIARQANQAELEEHGKRLDLMVGLTLHMYSVASRAMPGALRAISGRLRQLQDSRTLVHNPMTEQEADVILREVFPDEPATGRSS